MALLAAIMMLSQLQEVVICYHVALVIHICCAFPCQAIAYLRCSCLASCERPAGSPWLFCTPQQSADETGEAQAKNACTGITVWRVP